MNVLISPLMTLPLCHREDCSILGVTMDGRIYVEEMYGDGWLAQHIFAPDGHRLMTVDEDGGTSHALEPLALPDDLTRPQPGWHATALNFAGPRHRGQRESERLSEVVRTISIQDKMALISTYRLPTTPPMLLGLAESFVLAEAPLSPPNLFVVCRRIRLAYALPAPCADADNGLYDYDTFVLYLAHIYDRSREATGLTADADMRLPEPALYRPMDCLIDGDRLYIADGGDETRLSYVHVWQLTRKPAEAPDDVLRRKLYG